MGGQSSRRKKETLTVPNEAAETLSVPTEAAERVTLVDETAFKYQSALQCSICMCLVWEPMLTPCQHIFCRECIVEQVQRRAECPIDRRLIFAHSDLKRLQDANSLLFDTTFRFLRVRCPNHGCKCMSDYGSLTVHLKTCAFRKKNMGGTDEKPTVDAVVLDVEEASRQEKPDDSVLRLAVKNHAHLLTSLQSQRTHFCNGVRI